MVEPGKKAYEKEIGTDLDDIVFDYQLVDEKIKEASNRKPLFGRQKHDSMGIVVLISNKDYKRIRMLNTKKNNPFLYGIATAQIVFSCGMIS